MCIKKNFMLISCWLLKKQFTQKFYPKFTQKCTHPQAIQDVDEFVLLLEKILGNVALFSSEWVPSQWEFKQQIKTSQ